MAKVNDDNIEVTDADLDKIDAYLKRSGQVRRAGARFKVRSKARAALEKRKELSPERVAGLEWEAWHQKVMGRSIQDIASQMEVSVEQVRLWLQDAMDQAKTKTAELIEFQRELDLQRTDMLLERYVPLALMDKIVIQKIRQGEPIEIADFQAPHRSAYLVIELIKLRNKILRPNATPEQTDSSVDVVGWLHTQKEFISKAVKNAPRDVLTLEVENPIDYENPTTFSDAT